MQTTTQSKIHLASRNADRQLYTTASTQLYVWGGIFVWAPTSAQCCNQPRLLCQGRKTVQQVKINNNNNNKNIEIKIVGIFFFPFSARLPEEARALRSRTSQLPFIREPSFRARTISFEQVWRPSRAFELAVNIWNRKICRILLSPKWQHSSKPCMKFNLILLYSCYRTLGLNVAFLSQNAKLIYHNAPPGEIYYRSLSKTSVLDVHVHTIFILLLSSWKIPSVCNASDIIAGMPTEYDTYANLHPAVEKHTQGFHYHIH